MLIQTKSMTQYPSTTTLSFFAFAVFLTYVVACRWFIYIPPFYQLIRIIRVTLVSIINVFIGLSPLIAGFMLLGSYTFGYVSNISKSYFRFLQMFVGVTFGDDLFNMFSYYTDGTDLMSTLAFFYVTLVAILAGYICFPAFTSTISFLHKTKVVPDEEREAVDRAENDE